MLKPMFALLAVTLVASFLLGLVYTVTEGPIAEQKARAEMEAIDIIMEGTVSTEEVELFALLKTVDEDIYLHTKEASNISKLVKCYDVTGAVLGHVFSVSPKGYGGSIDMMVGISGGPIGVVQGVEIISHSETPGLGANADTPEFTDQFKGKESPVLNVVKIGPAGENEIEAIASATITTQAVTNGVMEATNYYLAFQLGVE